MFGIDLTIESIGTKTGLEALDLRRRLGVGDGVLLIIDDDDESPLSKDFPVDEAFARLYFAPSAVRMRADVRLSALVIGDLVASTRSGEGEKCVRWADISQERAVALFIGTPKEFRTVS